jgi:hypothetical protein
MRIPRRVRVNAARRGRRAVPFEDSRDQRVARPRDIRFCNWICSMPGISHWMRRRTRSRR